ncbi:hypothetical protein [Azospirillum sp. Sh1]|uniref:hypothetical protein n=1 Tax=Azospirillum sp. Sh1 TaxID=2607285 RepID=UPI0011F044F0|nr:hypothetical protein [Azospirillum sp. Sh1]KAA0569462.1 hypothetical protein FZ029_32465 [Azospirillum sp. Sh1]
MKRLIFLILLSSVVVAGLFWFRSLGPATDGSLLEALAANRVVLSRVGDALLEAGDGARIDISKAGAITGTASPESDLTRLLRGTPVEVAEVRAEFNGVLFQMSSVGISVSGASSGLIYSPDGRRLPSWAIEVPSLDSGLEREKEAKRGTGRKVSAFFVRPIDPVWAAYLDVF